MTLASIPVDSATTLGTAPYFLLFLEPSVNADFLLPLYIVQDFAVVTHAVVVEIDDPLTGKIGALSAVG